MKSLKIIVIILIVGGLAWYFSRPTSLVTPKPAAVPLVGDLGSNVNQVQQREFDAKLEKLNARIDAESNAERDLKGWQECLVWPLVAVNLLLVGFAWVSGTPPPAQPDANNVAATGNGKGKRTWQSWVTLLLAFIMLGFQKVNDQLEVNKNNKAAVVKRLHNAVSQARIAFGDAKTNKEYDSAIDMLRKAELDIE